MHGISRSPRSDPNFAKYWQGDVADGVLLRRLLAEVRPRLRLSPRRRRDRRPRPGGRCPNVRGESSKHSQFADRRRRSSRAAAGRDGRLARRARGRHDRRAAVVALRRVQAGRVPVRADVSVAVRRCPSSSRRVFIVYGPGQDDPKKLIPYVVTSLLRGESPKLSSGKREIDWIYVDDAAEGLIAAALARDVTERFDLGSGPTCQYARACRASGRPRAFGGQAPVRRLARPPDGAGARGRRRQTSRLTGWSPRTPLEEGLRRTVEWLRARHA